MSLDLLTRADAVGAAMDEYDELGSDAFLAKYGYGRARAYFVERDGKTYDSKAIAGVAVGKQHPNRGPLRSDEFSGGDATVRAKLEALGFKIVSAQAASSARDIRAFVIARYIEPARLRGEARVAVRAGDVHRDMGLTNAVPAVCSALGAGVFDQQAGVVSEPRDGPYQSTTTTFHYRFPDAVAFDVAAAEQELRRRYGDPIVDTQYVIGFRLPDDREIALQRETKSVAIWLEDDGRSPPDGTALTRKGPTEGRNSNLPPRLRHAPPGGVQPRAVMQIKIDERATYLATLDWYEGAAAPRAPIAIEPARSSEPKRVDVTPPTNLILYGPPGTGKTYATAAEAVRLCDGFAANDPIFAPEQRAQLMARYGALKDASRIEFVTFHQSYGYEDFVEGLRPHQAAASDGSVQAGFGLLPRPGIFKRIARRAQTAGGHRPSDVTIGERRVFKMSIGEAANPEDDYLFQEAMDSDTILLGWSSGIDWSDERFSDRSEMIAALPLNGPEGRQPSAHSGEVKYPYTLRNRMQVGDLVVISKGNSLFRAIGEVIGPYEYAPRDTDDYAHRRKVRWLWRDPRGVSVEEIYPRGFAMGSLYELSRADLNGPSLERYIASGFGTQEAPQSPPEAFVLIIDEINRANVSKVFGELITLIEPTKRLGSAWRPNPEGLSVTLPYSDEEFGVPANLHIIGTMNTADRSIALLDTALRRRFRFKELMPDPSLLADVEERTGLPLVEGLARLNARIEYLFDREHQIGHAFFLKCATQADVDDVMRHEILPLLAEYFHEDWEKIWKALNEPPGAREGGFLIRDQLSLEGTADDEFDVAERYRYSIKPSFERSAYQRLIA